MVRPGSSRTSAGPPTCTSPVYVCPLILLRSENCRWSRIGSTPWTLVQVPRPLNRLPPRRSSASRRPSWPPVSAPASCPPSRGSAPPDRAAARRVVALPATERAAGARSGELSAAEVVRAPLPTLAAVGARIGASRVVRADAAPAEAAAVDASPRRSELPLAGVPIAVKDNVAVTGEVSTDGSLAHDPAPATTDHAVVARLREAGAVVIGITRVPELCIYSATDGPGTVTRNPWDTARSSAGSSGGSAAAVAAGVVPLAHGNDGMGSLRLPAAACGLITLKPGSGVVPADVGADSWSGMAENGVLATTVADLAAGVAVLAGWPVEQPPAPAAPLRIAVSTRSPVPGVRLDPAGRAAVDAVVSALEAAGHT